MEKLNDIMIKAKELYKVVNQYYHQMVKEQSKADKELVDLYHYIEFYDLSACDGFKMYKRLQDCLRRRRMIKDEVEACLALRESLGGFKENGQCEKRFEKLQQERNYNPRTLKDLFKEKKTTDMV